MDPVVQSAPAVTTMASPGDTTPGPSGLAPRHFVALGVSVGLHALLVSLAAGQLSRPGPVQPLDEVTVFQVHLVPPPEVERKAPRARTPAIVQPASPPSTPAAPQIVTESAPQTPRPRASMEAPAAPTAEEWAFAGRYTLKNSKAYRYTWGQQVRSMMGTAVEGPDQGMVRFRVEIAPDGALASLETLWSTSAVAERLARHAIAGMPRLPATPTGQPLVFERTITFSASARDDPPLYQDDCLPDPPVFRNPFAWDGKSEREPLPPPPADKPDPQALEDCLKQLPQDSIEAEMARDRRLMERWGWSASPPAR